VSGRDAIENEMGWHDRIGIGDAELLLSNPAHNGEGPAEPHEVRAFVRALPAAVATHPDPAVADVIVSRAAMAAHAASLEASRGETTQMEMPRRGSSWRRRVAVAAVAIALLPAAMAGLAVAGLSLPEPAREAFESVGIELPNQPDAEDQAPAGAKPGRDDDDGAAWRDASDVRSGGGAGAASQGPAQPDDGGDGPGNAGNEKGGQSGQSQGGGPESTPPGHGATPPGQGGVPPGQGEPPPGHEVVPPSEGGAPPGQAGTAPGQAKAPKEPRVPKEPKPPKEPKAPKPD
jgi:hypothetical protein